MPDGERAFADSAGPRRKITALVSEETHLLLRLAAADVGMSLSGFVVWLLTRWADEWLRANAESLAADVAAEKERRAVAEEVRV